jgi:GNAT superfamily N-acetyltransferase
MDEQVKVRALEPGDLDTLVGLIEALAHYEYLAPPDAAARGRLAADAFCSPPRFSALLAEIGEQALGYAVYFETYSTFLAQPTLYLEDLFVLPEARQRGVGAALFRACAAEAQRRGCGRMEWQVLAWNDLAIGFYEHLGAAPLHADWRCYRLDTAALARLVEGPRL